MKNFISKTKFCLIPYLSVLLLQSFVYFFSKIINSNLYQYDFTLDFDRTIPLIPSFSVIYLGCYLWWAITPFLVGFFTSKQNFYKYIFAHFIGFIIGFLFFIIIPTTIERPNFASTDLFTWLTNFIYKIDTPTNLFPSMHCMISYFCFLAFRGKKGLPKFLVTFQLIFAILVCVSTQLVKQHYIVDVFAAILIAEVIYGFLHKINFTFLEKFFTKLNRIFKLEE